MPTMTQFALSETRWSWKLLTYGQNWTEMIDVAIGIGSWNVRNYLSDCLRSVAADLRVSRLKGEIWVVDNASTDGTVALLEDLFPQVHVIANQANLGFGAANNMGMRAASSYHPRYYFFLN